MQPPIAPRGALQSAELTIEAQRTTIARLEREAAARATTPEQVREMRAELGQALHERDLLGRLLGEERA